MPVTVNDIVLCKNNKEISLVKVTKYGCDTFELKVPPQVKDLIQRFALGESAVKRFRDWTWDWDCE